GRPSSRRRRCLRALRLRHTFVKPRRNVALTLRIRTVSVAVGVRPSCIQDNSVLFRLVFAGSAGSTTQSWDGPSWNARSVLLPNPTDIPQQGDHHGTKILVAGFGRGFCFGGNGCERARRSGWGHCERACTRRRDRLERRRGRNPGLLEGKWRSAL